MATLHDSTSTPPKRLTLPTDLLEAAPLLTAGILKVVSDSLAQETVPATFEQKDPEAALAKAIGERGPVAKIAKKFEIEANISKFKAVVATLQGGGDDCSELLKAAQANLDAAVAQLGKISKDTPSPTHEHKALLEVRSAHEANTQARRDREQKGLMKAAERLKERHQHIADLKSQLEAVEAGLTTIENKNAAKHADRATAAAAFDAKVLSLLDARIASAASAEASAAASTAVPLGQLAIPPAVAPVSGQAPAPPGPSQPPAQPPSLLEELAAARTHIEQLQQQVHTQSGAIISAFEHHFVDVDVSMLPKASPPSENEKVAYAALFQAMSFWFSAGAACPFEWHALSTTMKDAMNLIDVAKALLGNTLWELWYPTARPDDMAVVPRQVAILLYQSLSNLMVTCDSQGQSEADALAKQGLTAMRESGKRMRLA